MRGSTLSSTMVIYLQTYITMMTPDQAAMVIQNAWRRFDDDRKDRCLEDYNNELWDTYYRECCSPGDWSFDDMYPERPVDYEGMNEVLSHYNDMDDYDPPDEVMYYRY